MLPISLDFPPQTRTIEDIEITAQTLHDNILKIHQTRRTEFQQRLFFQSKFIEANIHAPKVINHRTILEPPARRPVKKPYRTPTIQVRARKIIRSSQHLVPAATVAGRTTIALVVLVLARLAPVFPCVFSLVAGESASKSSEEAVVCLSAENTATNAAGDGAHEATVTLLAVGVVRVALTVLVTLSASG